MRTLFSFIRRNKKYDEKLEKAIKQHEMQTEEIEAIVVEAKKTNARLRDTMEKNHYGLSLEQLFKGSPG